MSVASRSPNGGQPPLRDGEARRQPLQAFTASAEKLYDNGFIGQHTLDNVRDAIHEEQQTGPAVRQHPDLGDEAEQGGQRMDRGG
jgi:hypothetical protein